MSAQSRRLLTAFLAVSIVLSTVCLPVGAAVKPGQQMPACSGPENISGDSGGNGAFIMDRTEKQTPVDISSAKWKTVGGHLRLLSSDGKYRTGFVRVNGRLYFFDSKGNLTTGFFTYKGKKYYASCVKGEKGKGQILTGLVRIGTYFYFLNPASTPYPGAVSTGFQKIKGRRYYFNSKGHMVTGWFTVSGSKYYASCNKKGHYGSLLTGVQKIGNKTYRLDSNGKLVGQVGGQDPDSSNLYRKMIDVSEHQGKIDFQRVKASGVRGVIIRAGHGKNGGRADYKFHSNITKAKAAGLPVGIYWFSYAGTKQKAINEAKMCLRLLKAYKIDMPVYFDWEYDSMDYTHVKSRTKITDMTVAFCNTIIQGGRRAGYYFNLSYYNNFFDNSRLKRYSTWYAYWGTNQPAAYIWGQANKMKTPTRFDLWQFSSRGRIPGINGYVDCDLLLHSAILQ